MYGWDDRRLGVAGESGRKAELRRLQSWWRQAELRAAPGEGPSKRSEPVGNQLTRRDIEAQPYLNFLHPFAYRHALRRIDEVQVESGTLEADRLLRNLLSSMPLAFNAFGALGDHPQFVELLRATFAPRAVGVEEVICEWSPRPKASHLDDNTAFDAVVFYRDDLDRRCALGVEVKYTDSFSPKEYDTARYRALTETSGWFAPGAADRLKGSATNQMWRNVLLAASIERDGTVDRAHVAILCPAGDAGAAAALDGVQAELVDAELSTSGG